MWKLKIAEGNGPYLYSTNNYVGRQIWEFDPEAGTPEERAAVEKARDEYKQVSRKGRARALPCGDILMRMQFKKENSHIDLSIPPVRLGTKEDVTYEATTTALRKAVRLNCAIQAPDGHWAAENAGPMFFYSTPPHCATHKWSNQHNFDSRAQKGTETLYLSPSAGNDNLVTKLNSLCFFRNTEVGE